MKDRDISKILINKNNNLRDANKEFNTIVAKIFPEKRFPFVQQDGDSDEYVFDTKRQFTKNFDYETEKIYVETGSKNKFSMSPYKMAFDSNDCKDDVRTYIENAKINIDNYNGVSIEILLHSAKVFPTLNVLGTPSEILNYELLFQKDFDTSERIGCYIKYSDNLIRLNNSVNGLNKQYIDVRIGKTDEEKKHIVKSCMHLN